MKRIAVILLCLLLAPCLRADDDEEAERLEALDEGEILTYTVDVEGPDGEEQKRAQATGVVEAPPEKVFRVITDYDGYTEFMPHVIECEVPTRVGNILLCRQVLEFTLKDVEYTIRLELDPVNLDVTWEHVTGNIDETSGSWDLSCFKDDPERTLAVYTVFVDTGFWVPGFIERAITKGSLPGVIEAVRERVKDPVYDGEDPPGEDPKTEKKG